MIASLLQAEEVQAAFDLTTVGGTYNFSIFRAGLGTLTGTATVKKNTPSDGVEGEREIKGKAKVGRKTYSGVLTLTPNPNNTTITYFKRQKREWHHIMAIVTTTDGTTIQGTYNYQRQLRDGTTQFVESGTLLITKVT